jgi:hypothetical protein
LGFARGRVTKADYSGKMPRMSDVALLFSRTPTRPLNTRSRFGGLNRWTQRFALLGCLLIGATTAFGQTDTAETEGGEAGEAAPAAVTPDGPDAEAIPATDALLPATGAEAAEETALEGWLRFLIPRVLVILLIIAILTAIAFVRAGHVPQLRDIPGLMVFDEAVSRATEMGRPTLFTAGGASDLKRVQTFAAMPLLRRVSQLSGELGNRLMVPVCYPETMPVHINAMKDGYIDAGTLDMFHADDVRYFPGGQFFFAIASMGWMMRERPATCFYFGHWEADSLLFAETGQTLNAMQIAGTDQLYQIPFFVASCDYTIIGEEFWAASAKMSQDPNLLGSVAAQDVYKITVLVFIVVGSLLASFAWFNDGINFLEGLFKG